MARVVHLLDDSFASNRLTACGLGMVDSPEDLALALADVTCRRCRRALEFRERLEPCRIPSMHTDCGRPWFPERVKLEVIRSFGGEWDGGAG